MTNMSDLDRPRRDWLKRAAAGVCSLATAGGLSGWAATVVHAKAAPRLVTVGGAITEMAYLLGVQAQLVGTDTTSLYPAGAARTPKVGYMRQLSAEGVLSLRPDAVIATSEAGPPAVLAQLRGAGVAVHLVESDHTWDEVRRKLDAVARAADRVAQAGPVWAAMQQRWISTQTRVRMARAGQPRVLFVLAHGGSPMVAGERTAADAVIRFAGGRNALAGFQGYRPMTAEALAAATPDVILTTTQGLEAIGGEERFWQRPELLLAEPLRRKANGLLHMDALALLGFGPRLPEAVAELHERLVRS